MNAREEDFLKGLNAQQREGVLHGEGPCIVVAAAGSGKTKTLVNRIARLVHDGVDSERILAVTFSKKAADEMNHRLEKLRIQDARVGTWHSLCLQILKDDETEWAEWTIDSKNVAKTIMKEVLGFRHLNWTVDLGKVLRAIGIAKSHLLGPDELREMNGGFFEDFASPLLHFKIIDAYELWQRLLEERGLLTFDDFLVFAHRHLASHEDVRRKWASSWDYVLQDECQDASLAQNQIAKLLAQDHKNYMIVGDYRQAIYEWRGADPKMMLAFEKEWGARRIGLMRNYRSGKAIVRVANALTNEVGVDAMVADRSEEGIVRIVHVTDAEAEARAFADFVQEGIADGLTPGHFALLYRTNDLSRSFEEILLSRAIPHEVVGGANFYERKEIKDLLAYLRCAIEMNGEATRRCINAPFRFLGKAFVDRVEAAMEFETEDPVLVVREVAKQQGIQKRQKQSVDEWCAIVTEIRALEEAKTRPSTLLQKIILQTKYIDWLRKDEGEDDIDSSRSKNVQELLRSAERFETTYEFLQYVRENDANTRRRKGQRGDRVRLMTIHRSKGLEFSRVWLASFVEGSLPHFKGDPDSERRVAYVGMTRAQDELVFGVPETIMTSKGAKEIYPSRYLAEIGIGGEKKEKKLPSLDRHTTSVA